MATNQETAEEVIEQGEALVEEKATESKNSFQFVASISTAVANVKRSIGNSITGLLEQGLASNPFTSVASKYSGAITSGLLSAIDKVVDPSLASGIIDTADKADANFIADKTNTTDKEGLESLAGAAGAGGPGITNDRLKEIAVGAFGAVSAVAPKIIPDEAKNFQKFSVLASFLLMHSPKTLWGFAQEASEAFGTKNLERRLVLTGIKEVVVQLYEQIEQIPDEWYDLNLKQRIIDAIGELESADAKLLKARIKTYQNLFDLSLFEDAGENIKRAIDDLSDYSGILDIIGNPLIVFSMVTIYALLATLKQLTKRLTKLQADLDAHKANIEDFKDNFLQNSRYNNMSATLIANIQSQIRNTIREMNESVSQPQKIKIMGKLVTWIARINIIYALMDSTSKVLEEYIDSDPDGYTSGFDDIAASLNSIDFHEENHDINTLIFYLKRYHSDCLQKTSVNTDLAHIEWRKDQIVNMIDEQLDKSSLVVDALLAVPDVVLSLIQDGGTSVLEQGKSICTDVVGMADELGFDQMAKSLKSGDWKTFFSLDSKTGSSEGKMKQQVEKLKSDAETPLEKNVEDDLDKIKDALDKSAKAKRYGSTITPETMKSKTVEDEKRELYNLKLLETWLVNIKNAFAPTT